MAEGSACKACGHKAHCGVACPTPFAVTHRCFSGKGKEVDDCVCHNCRCPECLKNAPMAIREMYEDDPAG